MRLIDADAIEWGEQLIQCGNGKYEYVRIAYMDDIDDLPTIEPERKKGKWIPVTKITTIKDSGIGWPTEHVEWVDATEPDEIDAVRCSECGEVFDFEGARNWCTECGTDMRGEQE